MDVITTFSNKTTPKTVTEKKRENFLPQGSPFLYDDGTYIFSASLVKKHKLINIITLEGKF